MAAAKSKAVTKPSTAVAKPKPASVAPVDFDPSADAGMGMEGTTQESFAIPFLSVLQKTSPQVDEADIAFIDGAKAGQFIETVSKTLFDGKKGVSIIPCAYRRVFLRWAPLGSEGGFKGEIAPEIVARMRENGQLIDFENKLYFPLEDGTVNPKRCDHVADTRNHYILLDNNGVTKECLLSLTSTQIKKSKQLMSLLASKKNAHGQMLPTFATVIRATSGPESNDKGNWYGINFAEEGAVSNKTLYEAAKSFYKSVVAGAVKANYEKPVAEATAESTFD